MKRRTRVNAPSIRTGRILSRRTLLRGAGTVAVGLPLLDAMRSSTVYADGPAPPVRAFNLFFGLGFPTPLQAEGFTGPMEPLAPLADKLCVLRGVNQRRADLGGVNAHYDGAGGSFTGVPPVSETRMSGGTLDQALRRAAYPAGQPDGVIPTLVAGTFFRRNDRPYRYIHSWNDDGSPADLPAESPQQLFERVFGSDPTIEDPDQPERRRRRSILDAVLGQYQHYQSDASNLGIASRTRIADHLDRVRQHEMRVFGEGVAETCTVPGVPGGSAIPHGDSADPGGEGIDITFDALTSEFQLMASLYAMAVQCDVARFGSLTFLSAGERIRLTGAYRYDGRMVYDFNDRRDRGGASGAQGCSHEFWHAFSAGAANTEMRAHLHMKMSQLAYFMTLLDDPDHADENGGTILDNAMLTISTESGDGRHNDVPRELSGIFHVIGGACERFATGQILELGDVEGLDVYNTMLEAMGVDTRLGPAGRTMNRVDAIRR